MKQQIVALAEPGCNVRDSFVECNDARQLVRLIKDRRMAAYV